MERADVVKPPAKILYPCLPDYQRNCRCTLADLLARRDCGIVIQEGKRR